jgi:hypothetical protein
VCRTCSRAFTSFQALGGHWTSHLRGRHDLEFDVGTRALIQHKQQPADDDNRGDKQAQHKCHIYRLGFKTGQVLGVHMRRATCWIGERRRRGLDCQ